MRLTDRIALVTAAGAGMGRASAEMFAAHGATVVVSDISPDATAETVRSIEGSGGTAVGIPCDVGDRSALEALFATIDEQFGRLDVAFNHAGTPGPFGLDADEADVDRFLATNVKSMYFATAFAVPLMRRTGRGGSLIYTSSSRAIIASPKRPLYSFAKGGLLSFVKAVAKSHGPDGIRANALLPGHTRTGMTAEFFATDDDDKIAAVANAIVQQVPLGREGLPADVAPVALFLASDDSAFVSGVGIPVDGGYLA